MPKKVTRTKKLSKEEQLQQLVAEMYATHEKKWQPLYPYVMVRVLPKENIIGSIIIPDKVGKVIYEGIVLVTWKPFYRFFEGSEEDGSKERVLMQSDLKPGDHVLFPHFAGMPVLGYDEKHYRVVSEIPDEKKLGYGGHILMTYQNVEETSEQHLQTLLDFHEADKEAFEKIKAEFHIIPKDVKPVTTTG